MTENETFVVLASFFRDTYDEDPTGVSYWFHQNYKGDIKEFLQSTEVLRQKKDAPGM